MLPKIRSFIWEWMRLIIVHKSERLLYQPINNFQVYPPCWETSPEIEEFMKVNNYTTIAQVQEHYVTRHVDMVKSLGVTPISWQDPLDFGVQVHKLET